MNAISIVIRILAIAGAAAAAYFYFDLGDQLEETRRELNTTEGRLSQTQTELGNVEAERDELQERTGELEASAEEAQNQASLEAARATELEEELETVRSDLEQTENEAEEYRAETRDLREQLIAERENSPDVPQGDESLVQSQQREIRNLEAELEAAQLRLAELEPNAQNDGEGPQRVVNTIRGTVANVSGGGGFVVLDIGGNNGVRQGDEFMIHRNGSFIARVRVSRVDESESIAQILPGTSEPDIRRGDNVRMARATIN